MAHTFYETQSAIPLPGQPPVTIDDLMKSSFITSTNTLSVTIIVDYRSRASLSRQLHELAQQTLVPEFIWVSTLRDPDGDGGAHVRALVQAFPASLHISVVSVTTLRGAGTTSGTSALGRIACFQLALQAATRHVLVLDDWVAMPARQLEAFARAAELSARSHGVLGLAGWRSVIKEGGAAADGAVPEESAGVGDVSVALPDGQLGLGLPQITPVDVLRGAWFLRTSWVPLLFREDLPPHAQGRPVDRGPGELGEEAWISAILWRHGDLHSLVLPTIDSDAKKPAPPTAAVERAWRSELWAAVRRGDVPPPWRATRAESISARSIALLVVDSMEIARQMASLFRALRSERSLYDPRLVLSPHVRAAGGCRAVADAMGLSSAAQDELCARAEVAYSLRGNVDDAPPDGEKPRSSRSGGTPALDTGTEDAWAAAATAARTAASCGALTLEMESIVIATRPAFVVLPSTLRAVHDGGAAPSGSDVCAHRTPHSQGAVRANHLHGSAEQEALAEAVRVATGAHGVTLLEPPAAELELLEFAAVLPAAAMQKWHTPAVDVAIITHRRPTSLRRLLNALACAHYLGDTVDVAFSLEAGADAETVRLARTWAWPHGVRRAFRREAKGGLVTAVVESWFPSTADSYGLMLEDDIEVSPYFYVYLKALLLRHAYAGGAADGGAAPQLLGISLYTPRLVELTMPRKHIDLYKALGESGGGGSPHAFAQQLPCSWGQLFFPRPWAAFRQYMRHRLAKDYSDVHIARSACCPGWSTSWKKFLIEMSYLRGYVVLYPNLYNQTSLSTNHLEPGEHVQGKANTLKHKPIDFTVPLVREFSTLRAMWTGAAGSVDELPGLHALPTLDLFSERVSQDTLAARGRKKLAEHPEIVFRD